MDSATIRQDQDGLSSVANIRRNREERARDQIETARRQQRAEQGKKRSQSVTDMSGSGQAISGMVDAYFEEDEEGAQEIVQMIRQAEAIRDTLGELEVEHGNFSDQYQDALEQYIETAQEADRRAQASEYLGINPAQVRARELYIDARDRLVATGRQAERVQEALRRYGQTPMRRAG
jgi:CO/xanthine dehydrogenase Mo-binding subunit